MTRFIPFALAVAVWILDRVIRQISLDTVKSHVKRIFSKLAVRDRAQAVIAAYESGLISPRS